MNGRAVVIRGDARNLPLPDACVDLIVTSPPYFGLRSYTDGGQHYAGQIGSEATPAEFLAALWECTREWVRVLKPEGSLFVNLGDKYTTSMYSHNSVRNVPQPDGEWSKTGWHGKPNVQPTRQEPTWPSKSLMGMPWRYAIGCVDQLGLILRAEVIWAKPNGLPESVTDRVRRSHEQLFHFTRLPRYFSAVDEIREAASGYSRPSRERSVPNGQRIRMMADTCNPLGKLPGSVWPVPSAPLVVPEWLGVDHFACVDADTEILTTHGWLRHDELTQFDTVAGYDLETNTARWTECTAVNRYDYDGELIAVESRDLSMRLTPNHRTVVQRMHTRSNKRSPVTVVRADELDARHFIPRSAAWEEYGDSYVMARLAALFGWVAAEGWYEGKRVRVSQSMVNPDNVTAIDKLIPDAARSERRRERDGYTWTEVTWTLGPVGALVQREMPGKLLPWWLVMATEPERRAVLAAFIDGDGHRRPDGRIGIYQKHRHNLDVLQAIAVTLGYKTTIREGGGRFVLYLTEGGRSVTLRGTSGIGSKVRREHYRGVVWCPSTGTGTFIARRNGSVFVTGNSFPPGLVRPVVLGWSPQGVCTVCGQGRRPVSDRWKVITQRALTPSHKSPDNKRSTDPDYDRKATLATITGYACACPDATAPTRPSVVLDPFCGTGTTMLTASVFGRIGIGVDLSQDYCRLARWRCADPGERARALGVPKPPPVPEGHPTLFDDLDGVAG